MNFQFQVNRIPLYGIPKISILLFFNIWDVINNEYLDWVATISFDCNERKFKSTINKLLEQQNKTINYVNFTKTESSKT